MRCSKDLYNLHDSNEMGSGCWKRNRDIEVYEKDAMQECVVSFSILIDI